jgi:polyhydroxyalkanoate synthesis regulator phasin
MTEKIKDWKEEYEKMKENQQYTLHKLNKAFEENKELKERIQILTERISYLEPQIFGGSTK